MILRENYDEMIDFTKPRAWNCIRKNIKYKRAKE